MSQIIRPISSLRHIYLMLPLSLCACLLLLCTIFFSPSYSLAVTCWLVVQFCYSDHLVYRNKSSKTITLTPSSNAITFLHRSILILFFFCFVVYHFVSDLLARDDCLKLRYQVVTDFTNHTFAYDLVSFAGCISQPCPSSWQFYWLKWNGGLCNQSRFPCRIITDSFDLLHLLWVLTFKNWLHNKYRIVLISWECCLIARLT